MNQALNRQNLADSSTKVQNVAGTRCENDTPVTQVGSRGVRYKRPPGNVYFIRAGAMIKIGYSLVPMTRKADLQTSNPEPLELLATVSGTMQDERRMHMRFAHLHVRGEWFREDPAIFEFIRRAARKSKKRPALSLVRATN